MTSVNFTETNTEGWNYETKMTSVNLTDISVQDSEDPEGWNYRTIYSIEAVLILGTFITISCIIVFFTFLKKLK